MTPSKSSSSILILKCAGIDITISIISFSKFGNFASNRSLSDKFVTVTSFIPRILTASAVVSFVHLACNACSCSTVESFKL